jgi:hypothetical protein
MSVNDWRARIDALDAELLPLLNERALLSRGREVKNMRFAIIRANAKLPNVYVQRMKGRRTIEQS